MANKNFEVKHGFTTGNLSIDSSSGNITTTGNISAANVTADNLTSIHNDLSNAISNEISGRRAASADLKSAINTVSNAVSILSVAIANEATTRNTDLTSVNNVISTEIQNRINADNALSNRIDNLVAGGGTLSVNNITTSSINATGDITTSGNLNAGAVYADMFYQNGVAFGLNNVSVVSAALISVSAVLETHINTVSQALSVEINNRISADNALSVRIDGISQNVSVTSADLVSAKSNLYSAINTVSNTLSIETADRISAVNALSVRIDGISQNVSVTSADLVSAKSNLYSAVNVVSNSLSNEIANRSSADNALSVRIDGISQNVSVTSADLASAKSNLYSAIDVVSNSLSNEISVRAAAISNEISIRAAAINVLSNSISVISQALSIEIANRVSIMNRVDDLISNEISVRTAASAALESHINSLSNDLSNELSIRTAASTALESHINTVSNTLSIETADRVSAVNALSSRIDGISQTVSITSADLASAKSDLASAINVVSNALSNETSIRAAAIDMLSSRIISAAAGAVSAAVGQAGAAVSVTSAKYTSGINALSNTISALSNAISATYAPLSSPTFTGTVTAPSATGIAIGTPTLGALAGAVTMTTGTSISNGVAQLNQVISKLLPSQPSSFPNNTALTISGPSQRIMFTAAGSQTNNDLTNISTAAAGTVVYVNRSATYSTNTISTTGPGDSGTITVYRNGSAGGSHVMTIGNTTANVVYYTVTNTTTSSAVVTVASPSSGVLAAGHVVQASASFGGLTANAYYYVTAVSGSLVTLDTYNYSTGVRGAAFSGTTASGGTITLTEKPDAGTYTTNNDSLVLSNNIAYPATSAQRGFWETVDVAASGTSVAAGWNSVQIRHSGAGNTTFGANTTNQGVWYYDNTSGTAPTLASQTFAISSTATINSSTIPHYTSSTSFNLGFVVTWNAGQTGHSSTSSSIITGSSSGAFSAPSSKSYSSLGYTVLPSTTTITTGAGPNSTTFTSSIISGFGAQTNTALVPSCTADNSYSTVTTSLPNLSSIILYKNGTTGSTSYLEETDIYFNSAIGSGSGKAARVVNPDGGTASDNPAFTAGASAFSTLQATDATIVGTGIGTHALKYNTTDYSTGYLPAGPNLSTRGAGAQYFTFKFARTGVSKFNITYASSTGVAGIYCAMPGQTNLTGGNINSWLSLAIDNANSGGCALSGNFSPAATGTQSINCSFGTLSSSNATNNEIWIRIKLTSGQSITALYLGASTV